MKKRMFLSTILMTLVLLVAVTTATFAWYQATTSSQTATTPVNVTTADDEFDAGDVTINFALSGVTGNVGPTDTDGNIFFEDEAGNLIAAPNAYDKSGSVTWTVSVAFDDQKMTQKEAYTQVAGEYTVRVSGTDLRLSTESGALAVSEGAAYVDITFTISVTDGTPTITASSGTIHFAVAHTVEAQGTIELGAAFQN